jgi:hypothetical protein
VGRFAAFLILTPAMPKYLAGALAFPLHGRAHDALVLCKRAGIATLWVHDPQHFFRIRTDQSEKFDVGKPSAVVRARLF